MPNPKYPDIKVRLIGNDGNAFAVLGNVSKEMRRADVGENEVDAFMEEAMEGDYDHLLRTCVKWVSVT